MAYLPSVPDDSGIRATLDKFTPKFREAMSSFIPAIMKDGERLTRADKETIAAYVSQLNSASYCFAAHSNASRKHGVEDAVFDGLETGVDGAPVRDEFKPILHFVAKLTLNPEAMTKSDVDVVLAAGWSEVELHEAICVCARFNMMNRLTLGHGLVHELEHDPSKKSPTVAKEPAK